MSAAEALRAAHASGVRVTVDGESLVLEASAQPPHAVLDALSRYKVAIVELLRPTQGRWTADEWRACSVVEWLNQHPASVPAGTVRMVRQARGAGCRGPAVRDRAGNAYMAACRLLAGLASGAYRRRQCGAELSAISTWDWPKR